MTQRPIGPRQKVTLKITQAQADLILENDYIDQEVLDSLDFSEPHAGIVGLRCTLDALEEAVRSKTPSEPIPGSKPPC